MIIQLIIEFQLVVFFYSYNSHLHLNMHIWETKKNSLQDYR